MPEAVQRLFDRAKSYYTLAALPVAEVVALAADKPARFSVPEWQALLQVPLVVLSACES
jgi:hypothetical protein